MTLNIASSRSFGSRPPSRSRIASSSSSVTPSRRWSGSTGRSATVIGRPPPTAATGRGGRRARGALDERADDPEPVVRAEDRLGGALRVRHQAGHVAGRVHDAGDRPQRAVRVGRVVRAGRRAGGVDVAEQDLAVALERVERRVVGVVAALAVGDRHPQRPAAPSTRVGERRVEPLGRDRDLAAGEPERRVAQQRARARARPRPGPGSRCRCPRTSPPSAANAADRAHDRAEPGDDPGPQVVAVGEPARQDDRRDAVERRPARATATTGSAPASASAWSVSRSQLLPGKTTTPIADRHAQPLPCPGRRPPTTPPERLDRVDLDERVRQQLDGEPLDDRPRGRARRRPRPSARPAGRSGRRWTPSIPRWPRLPSTARPCGSRMPGLGVTLTANRKLVIGRSRPPRDSARSWRR